jgi:hypothetical protein
MKTAARRVPLLGGVFFSEISAIAFVTGLNRSGVSSLLLAIVSPRLGSALVRACRHCEA